MCFSNFFFDNKKPTLTLPAVSFSAGFKSDAILSVLTKAHKNPDSNLAQFVRISSKLLKPLIISLRFNVYNLPPKFWIVYLVYSSLTVSFFLPLALRLAKTLRPSADFILSLKPCLFFLFVLLG